MWYNICNNQLFYTTHWCKNNIILEKGVIMERACSFFGHNYISNKQNLINRLNETIEDLITKHNVVYFLFGETNYFNNICLSVVSSLKRKYPSIIRIGYVYGRENYNIENNLLERNYHNLHNTNFRCVDKIIHNPRHFSLGRVSYVERIIHMIDKSDFCILYYDRNYTPSKPELSPPFHINYNNYDLTKVAYNYVIKKEKQIINMYNL